MQHASEDSGHNLEPAIIFENEHLLVIEKPAGLMIHADGRTHVPTLSDWVLARYPTLRDVGGMHTLDSGRYVPRAGILHRIDRETSGVLAIAKDDETFYFLQRQFLDHSVEKVYHAFVRGVPQPQKGVIDLSIGRAKSDFRQWATGMDARGTLRAAVTAYDTLLTEKGYALLELIPKTGRTHQLRVHLKAIGTPILCDKRYRTPCALGFTRLALHASRLTLTIPSGVRKTFMAPLPHEFLVARQLLMGRDFPESP